MKKFDGLIVVFLFLALFLTVLFVQKYFSFYKEAAAQAVTPVIDSRSSTATAVRTPTTITWNHTVNNNVNRLLLVGVQQLANISSVTYNGISLTLLTQADSNMIFYLKNPPVGTYAIRVNIENSSRTVGGAMSIYNVNNTTPFDSDNIVNLCTVDGVNPVSITVPNTNTSQLVIGTASPYGKSLSEGAGMTRVWLDSMMVGGDFDGSYGNSMPGAPGNTVLSWNNQHPHPRVCVSGVAINPPPAPPTPTPSPIPCNLAPAANRTILFRNTWRYVVSHDASWLSHVGPNPASLPAGNYKVTLESFDKHTTNPTADQPKERWYLRMSLANATYLNTGTISDLPANLDFFSQVVNTNLFIPSDVTRVNAIHAEYPDTTHTNSVYPLCAAFDRISPTSTPVPTIPPTTIPTSTPVPTSGPPVVNVRAYDRNGTLIPDGEVVDVIPVNLAAVIKFVSTASSSIGLSSHIVKWSTDWWATTNRVNCGSNTSCYVRVDTTPISFSTNGVTWVNCSSNPACSITNPVGPFTPGVVNYYSSATDNNSKTTTTTTLAFMVSGGVSLNAETKAFDKNNTEIPNGGAISATETPAKIQAYARAIGVSITQHEIYYTSDGSDPSTSPTRTVRNCAITNIHANYCTTTLAGPSTTIRYASKFWGSWGNSYLDFNRSFIINPVTTPTSGPTPTPAGTYTISGNVYVDANRNGIKDLEGGYAAGAVVRLSGDASATTTSDASGNYIFGGLYDGTYTVILTLPGGYKNTTPISRNVTFP